MLEDEQDDVASKLKASLSRIEALEQEVSFLRLHNDLMRSSLLKARDACKRYEQKSNVGSWLPVFFKRRMEEPKLKTITEPARPSSKKLLHLSRSALEQSILQVARCRESAIVNVVVESAPGFVPNWKVSGIAAGNVEREVAQAIVLDAARQFATASMIADGSGVERVSTVKTRFSTRALKRTS